MGKIKWDVAEVKRRCVIDEDGCWIWQGGVSYGGRPVAAIHGRAKKENGTKQAVIQVRGWLFDLVNERKSDNWRGYVYTSCGKQRCLNPDCMYAKELSVEIGDIPVQELSTNASVFTWRG